MNTLTDQFRHGAEQAWTSLSEGWHELRARASGALTRFRRSDPTSAAGSATDPFASSGWGLLAADVRLEADRLVVRVAAPGMNRDDLHIDLDSDRLSVWSGKRFDSETRDGVLRIEIPRLDRGRGRRLHVQ